MKKSIIVLTVALFGLITVTPAQVSYASTKSVKQTNNSQIHVLPPDGGAGGGSGSIYGSKYHSWPHY